MLAKIRGLMAKAERTEFEGEREVYEAKINELIARYGIDQALLAAEEKTREDVESRDLYIENPYGKDKAYLAFRIYTALGCQTIQYSGRYDGKTRVKVYGFTSDLDRAEILFTSLLVQGMSGMLRENPADVGAFRIPHQTLAANRRAWLLGFNNRVANRVVEAERRAKANASTQTTSTGKSTDLVLRDRAVAVQDAFKAAHPRTRSISRKLTGSGYSRGSAAGDRADIGARRVGGSRKALA
jgi:hypothetical protein